MDDSKIHVIEPVVTSDKFEMGVHRLSVPGGWIYWLHSGAGPIGTFVPHRSPNLSRSEPLTMGISGTLSRADIERLKEEWEKTHSARLHEAGITLVAGQTTEMQESERNCLETRTEFAEEVVEHVTETAVSGDKPPADDLPVE